MLTPVKIKHNEWVTEHTILSSLLSVVKGEQGTTNGDKYIRDGMNKLKMDTMCPQGVTS